MRKKIPKLIKRVRIPKRYTGFDVNLATCWVEWRMTHGMMCLEFFSHNFMAPIGIMWGIPAGRGNTNAPSFEIIHCHVIEWARRQGVCRKMHEWIFDAWKGDEAISTIRTIDGTNDGGRATLACLGYMKVPSADVWIVTKSAFEQKGGSKK